MILRSSSYDPIVLYRRKSRGIAKDQRRINGGMARVNVRDDARLCVLQMMTDSSYKSQLLHYDAAPSQNAYTLKQKKCLFLFIFPTFLVIFTCFL